MRAAFQKDAGKHVVQIGISGVDRRRHDALTFNPRQNG